MKKVAGIKKVKARAERMGVAFTADAKAEDQKGPHGWMRMPAWLSKRAR